MFKLEIETTDDAFQERGYPSFEVGRILQEFGKVLVETGTPTKSGILKDRNGNTVGKWSYRATL